MSRVPAQAKVKVPASARFALHPYLLYWLENRSSSNWETFEEFKQDVVFVLKQFANLRRKTSLRQALVAALWLYVNVEKCDKLNAIEYWGSFVEIVQNVSTQYEPSERPSQMVLWNMKLQLANFFCDHEPVIPLNAHQPLSQKIPQDFDAKEAKEDEWLDLAKYFVEMASGLESRFKKLVLKLDRNALVGVKSVTRAFEKASHDYGMDTSRVLDYLRALVHIEIDAACECKDIHDSYNRVIRPFRGQIVRQKFFPPSEDNPLPRILLNLNYEGMIVELQVHFQFAGYDENFRDFQHTLYELVRKDVVKANLKEHVIELTMDLIRKLGVGIGDGDFKFKPGVTKDVNFVCGMKNDVSIEFEKKKGDPVVRVFEAQQQKDGDGDFIDKYLYARKSGPVELPFLANEMSLWLTWNPMMHPHTALRWEMYQAQNFDPIAVDLLAWTNPNIIDITLWKLIYPKHLLEPMSTKR
jgi:hypothetical protein